MCAWFIAAGSCTAHEQGLGVLLNSRAGAQGRGFITLQHVRRLGSVTLRRAKEVCHFVLTCAAYGPSVTHMPPPIAYTCTIPDQRACAVATGHYATTPGSVAQSRRKSQPCKQPAWSLCTHCACPLPAAAGRHSPCLYMRRWALVVDPTSQICTGRDIMDLGHDPPMMCDVIPSV